MKVEYVEGKANTLADFNSRMPVGDLRGLVDEEAFDLSEVIPPTTMIYTALDEWREDYNKRISAR